MVGMLFCNFLFYLCRGMLSVIIMLMVRTKCVPVAVKPVSFM
jgi:hypothetical protein